MVGTAVNHQAYRIIGAQLLLPIFSVNKSIAEIRSTSAANASPSRTRRRLSFRPNNGWYLKTPIFELVRELRKNKRKPTRMGIVCMFSGLVYCADCGEKLYYSATNNYKESQAYFFCSSYRKNSNVCSAHYIREKVIYSLVLENMQRVFLNVQAYEKGEYQKSMTSS